MGWAAKFGTGFFQGAAATFPESYARNQENKRQEEEQQAATYISLLNQTETEDEASSLVAQWQTDPAFVGLSPAVKSRVSAAAKGLGQLQGQKLQRETKATLGETHELSDVAIGGADSTNTEDYRGTPERLRAQGEKLSALALRNPKLREDSDFQAAQTKLNIGLEQVGIGRAGAEQEELSRKTALEEYETLKRTPGVAAEVVRAAGLRAGLAETVVQSGIQSNLALVGARDEDRKYQARVKAAEDAAQAARDRQERLYRQQDLATSILFSDDATDAQKQVAFPVASEWARELYAKGGTTASGIPEIDNQRDPIVKKALWDQLDPQVKATANPDFELFLNRRIQADEYKQQYKSQTDLDEDVVRAGALEIARTGMMIGEDGSPPDVAKIGADIGKFTSAYYQAKAQAQGTVDWSVAAEDLNTEFIKLGGTAVAAQSVYDRLLKTSATPEEKGRVLARLSERNAAFTPLLIQFNQQAITPAPADSSGLTLGRGLAIGGAVAVAGGMEVAANRNKNGNPLFPQGRMPLPWEKQTVGEGSVLAKSMAQDSRPGVGERNVVMPERTAFDPNAPATPVLQGEGRFGNAPPAAPSAGLVRLPEDLPAGTTPPPSPRTPTLPLGEVAGESAPRNLMPFGEGGEGLGKLEEALQRAHKAGAISAAEVEEIRKSGDSKALVNKLKSHLDKRWGKKLTEALRKGAKGAPLGVSALLSIPALLSLAEQAKAEKRPPDAADIFNALFGPSTAE